MQDLSSKPIDDFFLATGQKNWREREDDTLIFSSETKEKVMSVAQRLTAAGIDALVKKEKAKEGDEYRIVIKRDRLGSLDRGAIPEGPSIVLGDFPVEKKYKDKFQLLEKSNKVFDPTEFAPSVPNRFSESQCMCIEATRLRSNDKWNTQLNVHANHVKLEGTGVHVICSQAPKVENEGSFWEAVLEHSALILDLTNATDRQVNGVQRYFPYEAGTQFAFLDEEIVVSCTDEINEVAGEKKLKLHAYNVEKEEMPDVQKEEMMEQGQEKKVKRLHFRGWPDRGAIACADLSKLINYLRVNQQLLCGKPLWIHCRAGVGRSGTAAVALALAELFEKGELSLDNYEQKIDQLIQSGRHQRNNWFVQTIEQYKLLHEFALSMLSRPLEGE